jgi:TM2 domain-containing membrane protein YozV
MDYNQLYNLKGITAEEFQFVKQIISSMDEQQTQRFLLLYSGKRQSPSDLLLFTLLGLLVVAGVQRFIIGQIGMGILYFLTGGLCLIGTIVDAINHKKLADEFNQNKAFECAQLAKMS